MKSYNKLSDDASCTGRKQHLHVNVQQQQKIIGNNMNKTKQ